MGEAAIGMPTQSEQEEKLSICKVPKDMIFSAELRHEVVGQEIKANTYKETETV